MYAIRSYYVASAAAVEKLIERELERGIESSRIILAGFSQGGAVVYQAGLSYARPLAGLLVMSTYFATSDSISLAESNSSIPIEIHHGKFDPVVPEHLGKKAAQFLVDKGYSVSYRSRITSYNVCYTKLLRFPAGSAVRRTGRA